MKYWPVYTVLSDLTISKQMASDTVITIYGQAKMFWTCPQPGLYSSCAPACGKGFEVEIKSVRCSQYLFQDHLVFPLLQQPARVLNVHCHSSASVKNLPLKKRCPENRGLKISLYKALIRIHLRVHFFAKVNVLILILR